MGTMRDTLTEGGEGALHLGPERARVFADLSAEQKDRYKADIRATNILLQGIPKDIYTLINHFTDAKDIWDNVKMILEGSELTKDDRESQLYDEFEHFCQIKGETIHVYYVRFTKLINDMRNIKMTMSRMQLNSKFVNNMLPEWSRFITEVKLNRGLKESNFDQLYAYLKQHEVHANENRMMMERFIQPTNDPLALVSNASVQQYPTQSSESPQFSNQPSLVDNCQMDTGSTSTDNLIESLTNTLSLLITSSNARNKATVQDDRASTDNLISLNGAPGLELEIPYLLFLFILAMEGLHGDISNTVNSGLIEALHGQEGGLDHQGCNFNGTWSRIVSSSNFLHSKDIIPLNSFRFKVGCDTRIHFWKDIWIGDSPLHIRYNRHYRLEQDKDYFIIDRIVNMSMTPVTGYRAEIGIQNIGLLERITSE
ncbi:hypothetical protein Tco_1200830 [Tanacetum coccineum]